MKTEDYMKRCHHWMQRTESDDKGDNDWVKRCKRVWVEGKIMQNVEENIRR
jgi:hypothetical protein